MRPIPIITILLIANNWYLNYLIRSLTGWHFGLFHLGGIRDEYIRAHSVIISKWNFDTLALSGFTLILVIIIWRQGLCNRWLAAAISLSWLLMFVVPARLV